MKNRPNTSVPLARFSFPIVLFVSGMLLSLLTACDFRVLFGCKELPKKRAEVKYELFKKYISDLKNLYKNQGYATLFLQLKNALKDEIYI